MNKKIKCTKCHETKTDHIDFYLVKNTNCYRSHCKKCMIKQNSLRQKKTQPWKSRSEDPEERRKYMRQYYKKNKLKFIGYRENFKINNPNYYKDYYANNKEKYKKGE